MKTTTRGLICCLGGAGVLLAAGLATAATIPTTYLVDEAELKRSASAGTNLTFELYTDASCTVLIATDMVDVDAVTVKERVKTRNVRGGAKPLKLVELHHVFAASPTPGADLFVKVTGSGIDASAVGDCQAQEPYGTSHRACSMVFRPAAGSVAAYGTAPGGVAPPIFAVCCPSPFLQVVNSGWNISPQGACALNVTAVLNWQDSLGQLHLCGGNDGWDFQINDESPVPGCVGMNVDAFVLCCP
jgi:hypothetical protein